MTRTFVKMVDFYSVERVEPYRTLLEPMWQRAQDEDLAVAKRDNYRG